MAQLHRITARCASTLPVASCPLAEGAGLAGRVEGDRGAAFLIAPGNDWRNLTLARRAGYTGTILSADRDE
jgi:hypothetical protein